MITKFDYQNHPQIASQLIEASSKKRKQKLTGSYSDQLFQYNQLRKFERKLCSYQSS